MARQQTPNFPGKHKGSDPVQRKHGSTKQSGPSTGGGKAPGAGLKFPGGAKKSGKP